MTQRHDSGGPAHGLGHGDGHGAGEVVTGAGSGLTGKRPGLRRILSDPCASVVVVEYRDRLARFGVEHPGAGLPARGRTVVVTGPGATAGDRVRAMTGVLAWMCARRYGRRGAPDWALRAVTALRGGEAQAGG